MGWSPPDKPHLSTRRNFHTRQRRMLKESLAYSKNIIRTRSWFTSSSPHKRVAATSRYSIVTQYGRDLLHQAFFPCDLIALMLGIHRVALRADPRIRSGLRMAPCCQSVSPRHYPPPPTSPWRGALRAKVQELAPAPVQTTDQWARSRIDRATWVPEVPANPCSLSAALAARISSLVSPSVQQTGLYSGTHTHTHFPGSLTSFTPNPPVTHPWPCFSHHPPLSP